MLAVSYRTVPNASPAFCGRHNHLLTSTRVCNTWSRIARLLSYLFMVVCFSGETYATARTLKDPQVWRYTSGTSDLMERTVISIFFFHSAAHWATLSPGYIHYDHPLGIQSCEFFAALRGSLPTSPFMQRPFLILPLALLSVVLQHNSFPGVQHFSFLSYLLECLWCRLCSLKTRSAASVAFRTKAHYAEL